MSTRRQFLCSSGAALLTAGLVSRGQAAAIPEAPIQDSPLTQPPLAPPNGRPYNPVVTLNGWTLPWRMNNGVKEFHLIAEPVVRELAPGMRANLWGYNGQSPGPTIEVVHGDKVRLFVTNKLPEHTTIFGTANACPTAWMAWAGLLSHTSNPARPMCMSSKPSARAPSCTTRMPTK